MAGHRGDRPLPLCGRDWRGRNIWADAVWCIHRTPQSLGAFKLSQSTTLTCQWADVFQPQQQIKMLLSHHVTQLQSDDSSSRFHLSLFVWLIYVVFVKGQLLGVFAASQWSINGPAPFKQLHLLPVTTGDAASTRTEIWSTWSKF